MGPRTGSGFATDALTGDRLPGWPVFGARINDAVPDGSGGVYVAGEFTDVGGPDGDHLVHLLADGTVDPAFRPAPDRAVFDLAFRDGALYAAGRFRQIGGATREALARSPPGRPSRRRRPCTTRSRRSRPAR